VSQELSPALTASPATERRRALEVVEALVRELGRPEPHPVVELFGAEGALGPGIAAELARAGGPLIYLVPDEDEVESRAADLAFFLASLPDGSGRGEDPLAPPSVMELPAPESSPYAEMQPDRRTIMRRMAVLFRLDHPGLAPRVVVASAAAVLRRVLPPAPYRQLCHCVRSGQTVSRDDLVRRLSQAGYGRSSVVEDPGTFAVRGSVIDLFPPVYRHPVRLELFGDEIESLRLYDAATQRTLRPLAEVWLHPVRETMQTPGADPRARLLAAADAAGLPSSKTRYLLEQVEKGEEFFGMEALAPVFHARMGTLFEYLPPGTRLVVEEPESFIEEARRVMSRMRESAAHRRAEHRLALEPPEFVLDPEEAQAALTAHPRLELRSVEVERPGGGPLRLRLAAESNTGLRGELHQGRRPERGAGDDQDAEGSEVGKALRKRLRAWIEEGHRVRLVASSRAHADRLAGLLRAFGLQAQVQTGGGGGLTGLAGGQGGPALAVVVGPLVRGFRLPGDHLVVVSEEEIFGPRSHRDSKAPRTRGFGELGELAEGDPIVHEDHGVGRYRGLKKLQVRGVAQDFLHLEYDGGSLYVPVYRLGAVRRYVGGTGEAVRLDKLGGNTWQEKRRRVSAEARKIAEELLQLYAQRKALPGHPFPPPDVVFNEFEETFPFEETPDQARAIEAVLSDMQSETPMDRLVCGDVGYGKTEVALRATLLAALGGKQTAVLAPTTVLAEQHFVTFSERLRDFPVRVGSLSRFRNRADQARTVADLGEGKLDVVIGTHRLLSRDVRWKNLGLVVIDEEQRFGVTHKERLKEIRSQVDVLTLTATPIPRTLQMSMAGLREISIIATPPVDRLAIRTFVCSWDAALLGEAIRKELARGGQVFFVHNRVEDLARRCAEVQALAPQAKVAMAHGQMGEGELERVMIDFVDGKYDILCCTTIIEAGLDIPRANTMIVNHADRFGLAQLYQLRGRIGRAKERAFCYLVIPAEEAMTPEAKARLAVLQRFTELGAGFQVASHDLEIRGAGELLGDRQSGAVAAVGFDTYARLLEEAVAELRGQPIKTERDPEISVDVPAFLPDDFIPDTGQRLELYRRLAQAANEDEIRALLEEIQDRYGQLPEEAQLLGEVMVDKTLVRRIGALSYELGPTRMVLSVGTDTRLAPAKIMKLVQDRKPGETAGRWKLSPDMRLSYAFDDRERQDRLPAARTRLQEVLGCLA
jgi:transcription-repair coupling factor (superfamily II helicase)